MTEVINSKNAVATNSDETENILNAAQDDAGLGKILKFKKGAYLIGDDEIPLGTKFIVHINAWVKMWTKFADNKVVDRKVYRVALGERPTQVSDRVSRCWRQRVMMPPLAHALRQPIGSRKLGCADETEARICEGAATKAPQKSYLDGSNQIRCSFVFRCPQPYLVGACSRSPQCGIDPCGLIVGTRRLLDPYGDSTSRVVRAPVQVLGRVRQRAVQPAR
jgi:hypothetical protein